MSLGHIESNIRVDGGFDYTVGYKNEGGSGYFAIFDEWEHPDGTGEGWLEPAWINANETTSVAYGSYSGIFRPGTVTLKVVVFSGPSPNNFVETDRQVFTYTVRE